MKLHYCFFSFLDLHPLFSTVLLLLHHLFNRQPDLSFSLYHLPSSPSSQQPIPVLCKTIFFSTLANFFKHFHLPEFYPSVLLFISLYALLTPQFTATRFTNILTLINPLYILYKHLTNIHIHNSIYLTLINPQAFAWAMCIKVRGEHSWNC